MCFINKVTYRQPYTHISLNNVDTVYEKHCEGILSLVEPQKEYLYKPT
jgi:hypothetical protein